MILAFYQMRRFLNTFLFTLVALSLLFVIIDLFERLDKFIDKSVTLDVAAMYYIYYMPFIAKLIIPVASLLAALFSVGRLATFNEITAMRAAGMSRWRFIAPYAALSLLISGGQIYFNGWVVPQATTQKLVIERTALQEGSGGSLFNLYFRDLPTRNTIIEFYDDKEKIAKTVAIEEFGEPLHPRMKWRIDAKSMAWDSTRSVWIADSAVKRTMYGDSVTITKLSNYEMPFSIKHEQIRRLQREPEELVITELNDYIWTLKAGGKDTRRQEIDYYSQWAFPFANFIVVIIAVPFASIRRRGGIAVNIAAAMILAFVYIAFTEISKAVGATIEVPAVYVGWSANILFATIALATIHFTRR